MNSGWTTKLVITMFSVCLAAWMLPNRIYAESIDPAQTIPVNTHTVDSIPMLNDNTLSWPPILSKSAVVMDMSTGAVLYAKNPLQPHYPASITKIMTAELALENGHLDDMLTTSVLATKQDGNRVYLVPGETEPLEKLLYGLLLDSGNDAAVVIAEHYGGNVQHFADMMNQKAQSLGALHTHFTNPNGLPDPKHVTCSYDMALIARSAMQNAEFRKIVATREYHWDGQAWHSNLVNLNHMLFNYPGAIGIKTGYTLVAHETLVVAATRGNRTFLAVLMDTPMDWQIRKDATELLNYAFAHYDTQTLVHGGDTVGTLSQSQQSIPIIAQQDVLATIRLGHPISPTVLPFRFTPTGSIQAGNVVGKLDLQVDGQSYVTVPVILARSYELTKWTKKTQSNQHKEWIVILLFVSAVLGGVLARWGMSVRRRKRDAD